jgi:hypothetical protein
MTYKIRSFANGTNANGDPNLTFSLTVPAHIGRRLGEDARFMCEVRDDGILYRPITAAPERPLPAWLAGDGDDERAAAPAGAPTATTATS